MNWEAIGAVGEIVGAAGVIFSLVYLSIQLRSNTSQLKTDAYQRHLETYTTHFRAVTLDTDSVETLNSGLNDYKSLDATGQIKFHGIISGFVYAYQANRRLYQRGVLDRDDFEMWERDIVRLLSTKGGRQWWAAMQGVFWSEFETHINSLLRDKEDDIPGVNTIFDFIEKREKDS